MFNYIISVETLKRLFPLQNKGTSRVLEAQLPWDYSRGRHIQFNIKLDFARSNVAHQVHVFEAFLLKPQPKST